VTQSANSAVFTLQTQLAIGREVGSYSVAYGRRLRAMTGANVVSHSAFSSRRLIEPLHVWRQPVIDRLDELCKLEVGWDGYSAPPVLFSNANFAVSMLMSACPLDAPTPQIVPGSNGDLQIEWHTAETDIELHVRSPNHVKAWRLSPAAPGEGEEVNLTTDFTIVARWLAELAEASVAARIAAA
jgi:hypothetical protein